MTILCIYAVSGCIDVFQVVYVGDGELCTDFVYVQQNKCMLVLLQNLMLYTYFCDPVQTIKLILQAARI